MANVNHFSDIIFSGESQYLIQLTAQAPVVEMNMGVD